jgi:hypothetical protein
MKRRAHTTPTIVALIFVVGIAASQMLDVAHAQSLAGIWQCRTLAPTPWGMCQGKTILMRDGTFSRSTQCGALKNGDKGTYTAGDGYIHYKIEDCWPKEYQGKPMHCLKSETFYFQWVNPDTVRGQAVECFRSRQ